MPNPRSTAAHMATAKQNAYRTKLIKLVHVARRELGLDEPTYRAILLAQGGQESLSSMPIDGMNKVLDYLKAQGFRLRKTSGDRKQATGVDARKVRALWLLLHELGAVRDPSEAALTAYVQRMTGVDDVQWMRGECYVASNPQKHWQARAELVIETLKKWGMRFLPGAIVQLKDEVHALHQQGLLTQEQRECARKAFERGLDPNVGFDAHNFVWDNLRAAVGRPFPPRSN